MAIKYIDTADCTDKRVIARFDFNVPLKNGEITDSTRIDMALPTIKHILDNGAKKLILISHLGRPKGSVKPELSLEPVATYLADKLNEEVVLTESATDASIKTLLGLGKTKILLLENIRFHSEEEANDREFAQQIASYGDMYVNDAFGTAHRKHASTYEINAFFKNRSYGGFLLKKEIEALSQIVEKPQKPFNAIIGGAKVSDKIKIIESLLPNVANLLIGGAMAYPFLAAKGIQIGKSLCLEEDVKLAEKILKTSEGQKIKLPVDHICAKSIEDTTATPITEANIPEDMMGLDIGEKTISEFKSILASSKTILWNGPMGLFENALFNKGTFAMAKHLAELDAFTVVGGGDSVSAVNKAGLADKLSHVSTGGGASLEYIENGSLPGIQALRFGIE